MKGERPYGSKAGGGSSEYASRISGRKSYPPITPIPADSMQYHNKLATGRLSEIGEIGAIGG
jgi:hypothetical protein